VSTRLLLLLRLWLLRLWLLRLLLLSLLRVPEAAGAAGAVNASSWGQGLVHLVCHH
jgi:hypothetical protein